MSNVKRVYVGLLAVFIAMCVSLLAGCRYETILEPTREPVCITECIPNYSHWVTINNENYNASSLNWPSSAVIDNANGIYTFPATTSKRIAISRNGWVHVAWIAPDGNVKYSYAKLPTNNNTEWSESVNVSQFTNINTQVRNLSITTTLDGKAFIAWEVKHNAGNCIYCIRSKHSPSSSKKQEWLIMGKNGRYNPYIPPTNNTNVATNDANISRYREINSCPDVAYAPGGGIQVAWVDDFNHLFWIYWKSGYGWRTLGDIPYDQNNIGIIDNEIEPFNDHRKPSIVTDNDGNTHITFQDDFLHYYFIPIHSYNPPTYINKSSATLIPENYGYFYTGTLNTNPSIATDSSNTPYILYEFQNGNHQYGIEYRSVSLSLTWSSPTLVAASGSDPSIAIDENDTFHIIYKDNEDGHIYYKYDHKLEEDDAKCIDQKFHIQYPNHSEECTHISLALNNKCFPFVVWKTAKKIFCVHLECIE